MVHLLTAQIPIPPFFGNGDLSNSQGFNPGNSITSEEPLDSLDVNCSTDLSDHQNQNFNNRIPTLNDALEALRLGGVRKEINALSTTQPLLKESPSFADRVLFITNNHKKNL